MAPTYGPYIISEFDYCRDIRLIQKGSVNITINEFNEKFVKKFYGDSNKGYRGNFEKIKTST